MTRLRPFLMFEGQAAAALELYRSLFADAQMLSMQRYGPEEAEREGSVRLAILRLAGQEIMAIDSPAVHAFGFTPSLSLFVECEDEEEMERLVAGLGEEGSFLMPPGDYGFSRRFAWLNDRFGVSWQISLP